MRLFLFLVLAATVAVPGTMTPPRVLAPPPCQAGDPDVWLDLVTKTYYPESSPDFKYGTKMGTYVCRSGAVKLGGHIANATRASNAQTAPNDAP